MKKIILLFAFIGSHFFSAQNFTVVLDAGHGGKDKGATYEMIEEAQSTLEFSNLVQQELENFPSQLKTVVTRENDQFINLEERKDIANTQQADLLVSFHFNNAEQTSAQGISAFVPATHHQDESNYAAEQLLKAIEQFGFNNRGVLSKDLKILKDAQSPAVLLELGFISNQEDRALYQKYKTSIAKAVAKYILMLSMQ